MSQLCNLITSGLEILLCYATRKAVTCPLEHNTFILSQLSPFHILRPYFCKMYFNINSLSAPRSAEWFFINIFRAFFMSLVTFRLINLISGIGTNDEASHYTTFSVLIIEYCIFKCCSLFIRVF